MAKATSNTSKKAASAVKVMVLAHGTGLPMPSYQTAGAAGFDLAAAVAAGKPLRIRRGGFALVSTGFAFEIPNGFDLAAAVAAGKPLRIRRGGFALVPTGFAFEIPKGFEAQVRPRSGLAAKYGVTVLNAPGTIDSDYRGEVQVILINHGPKTFIIRRGDRIAQMIVASVTRANLTATAAMSATARGDGGFGSTGVAKATAANKPAKALRAKAKASVAKPFPRRRIAPTRPGRH